MKKLLFITLSFISYAVSAQVLPTPNKIWNRQAFMDSVFFPAYKNNANEDSVLTLDKTTGKLKFVIKGGTGISGLSTATANGFGGTFSAGTTPVLTLTTPLTGILKGNGTAMLAAVPGTDFVTITQLGGKVDTSYKTHLALPLSLRLVDTTLQIAQSNTTTDGYLSAVNWNTFNGKENSLGNPSTNGYVLSSTTGGVRSWIAPATGGGGGTVTNVAALTLGTTGTDLTSTVINPTTTPVITLNVPTASSTNRGVLSSTDWTLFNNKPTDAAVVHIAGTETITGAKAFSSQVNIGTSVANPTGAALVLTKNGGQFFLENSTGATDEKLWDILNNSTTLRWRAVNDLNSAANNYMEIARSGIIIKSTTFPGVSFGVGATPAATVKFNVSDAVLAGSGSLSGTLANLTQTWNTTGIPTAIKLNITNTASGIGSKLMDLQVAGNSLFNVDKSGNVGIGIALPTALIHLAAGTATAGTAPQKFTAGSILTTPEDGAIEYNGTHYYGTIGTTRYQLDQQSSGTTDYQTQTATAAQAVFTFTSVPSSYNDFWLEIWGVVVPQSSYTKSGSIITFTGGLNAGDPVGYHRTK
jgi:hypothetical protein